jgi:uncharacterized protein DUF2782
MTRSLFTAVLLALSLSAAGQSVERARPAGTTPLEEPPPPPLLSENQPPSAEPEVTMRIEGEETIQEYRVNGRVFMQRVTPRHGKPYVLMDYNGDGTFVRSDHPTDNGVRVPQWVLLTF